MSKEGRVIRQGMSAFKHFLIPQSLEEEFNKDSYTLERAEFEAKYNEYWIALGGLVIYSADVN